jgi:hypothetical protein
VIIELGLSPDQRRQIYYLPAGRSFGEGQVGKVWQITACDAACSYGVAWVLPELSAEAAATFLR